MIIALSPHHTTEDFKNGWTLDDKIEVFIDRIQCWQLGVAQEMVKKDVDHRGPALLHILFSYFEMIGKYQTGYKGIDKSKYYFKKGVRTTFPEIQLEDEDFLNNLYVSVRNGLYHIGMTHSNVLISNNIPGSLGHIPGKQQLIINPKILVDDLQIKFVEYAAQLRDKTNIELRNKFEIRFDFDNDGDNL